jgi:hypothetical protein
VGAEVMMGSIGEVRDKRLSAKAIWFPNGGK